MRTSRIAGAASLITLSGCAIVYSYGDYKDDGDEPPPVACQTAADCPAPDDPCGPAVCEGGVCGVDPERAGSPVGEQQRGDCHTRVCTAKGKVIDRIDDEDVPVDNEVCTEDRCDRGVPSNPPVDANTPCSEGSAAICDGNGHCGRCAVASDCGPSTECTAWSCEDAVCKKTIAEVGTPCEGPGECRDRGRYFPPACDATGSCAVAADPVDCVEYNCTDAGCNTGCTTSADCGEKYNCDEGACVDCVTCGEWMLGQAPAGAGGSNLCAHSVDAYNAINQCYCGIDPSSCGGNLRCNQAICLGAANYSDECGPCIDVCDGFHECQADL